MDHYPPNMATSGCPCEWDRQSWECVCHRPGYEMEMVKPPGSVDVLAHGVNGYDVGKCGSG